MNKFEHWNLGYVCGSHLTWFSSILAYLILVLVILVWFQNEKAKLCHKKGDTGIASLKHIVKEQVLFFMALKKEWG